MDTVKINRKNVKVVAHRGLSGIETENTSSAFVAAGNRSYFGIECDIHVTKDKKFVVIHDEKTSRVAGKDINVEKLKLKKIRKVVLNNKEKAGNISEMPQTRRDLVIPILSEYIGICKKYDKYCVLELKNNFSEESIKKVIQEIELFDYMDKVIFISFDFDNMVILRKLLPKQQLQFLVGSYDENVLKRLNTYNLDIDIYHVVLTKNIVDEIHANGHLVNCWTCDDKTRAEELVEMGVDYITSNILE